MFKKKIALFTLLLLFSSIGLISYLMILDPEDEKNYRFLVKAIDMTEPGAKETAYTAKQQRQQVQKHIFYSRDDVNRLQVLIASDSSSIVLDHHEETTEVVEHLKNVKCWIQEEFYFLLDDGREVIRKANGVLVFRNQPMTVLHNYHGHFKPMQVVRYLEAKEASYHYKTERLIAKAVNVASDIRPGHELVASVMTPPPTFFGRAESVELSLNGSQKHPLLLQGDVSLKHDLGKLAAGQMTLEGALGEKKIHFPLIKMKDQVSLNLHDGSQLFCHRAELNDLTRTGTFLAKPGEFVTYTDGKKGRQDCTSPFTFQSRQMKVHMNHENDSKLKISHVSDIIADDEVTVSYQDDLKAHADQATYRRYNSDDNSNSNSKQNWEGMIHLQTHGEDRQCQIVNSNGDSILADEIRIDTKDRHLAFIYPKGNLHISSDGTYKEQIDISADTMTWNQNPDVLTLHEHVSFKQPKFGSISSEKDLQVFLKSIDGKRQLQKIEADGKTVFAYLEKGANQEHVLTSYGKLTVDYLQKKTIIEAPRDQDGKVIEGQQVHFQDHLGSMDADRLTLVYKADAPMAVPEKIIIEGHVHISNQFHQLEHGNPLLQYALADEVEYSLDSQEMLLKAKENSRVLFFDKGNNIQVSAETLKVKRDPNTQKESFQGTGEVRFTFLQQEIDQMKEQFHIQE